MNEEVKSEQNFGTPLYQKKMHGDDALATPNDSDIYTEFVS